MDAGRLKGKSMALFLTALGFLSFTSPAWSESFDTVCCGSANYTLLSTAKELVLVGYEGKGISTVNDPKSIFYKCTWQAVGVTQVKDGIPSWVEYRKYMDSDGDIFYVDLTGTGNEGSIKFHQGTGKFRGIKGEGKTTEVIRGKAITPGTGQYCGRAFGLRRPDGLGSTSESEVGGHSGDLGGGAHLWAGLEV